MSFGFLTGSLRSIVGRFTGGLGNALAIFKALQRIATTAEAVPDDPTAEELHELSRMLGNARDR